MTVSLTHGRPLPADTRHRALGGAGLRSYALQALLDVRQAVLTCVVALLLIAVGPVLAGWHSTVVVSGSMAPGIRPGDVVIARPTTARVAPGTVVLVDNPAVPGELLLHRLADYDNGQMILKGDANLVRDSTPVPIENLEGVASLRIPYLGLPFFWISEGRYRPALAAGVFLLGLALWRPARRPPVAGGRHRVRARPGPATEGVSP